MKRNVWSKAVGILCYAVLAGVLVSDCFAGESAGGGTPVLDKEALVSAYAPDDVWYIENIPFLDCPDRELQEIYYYRWSVAKMHLRNTGEHAGYVVTEFAPRVSWSRRYNTIAAAAMLHVRELRWLWNRQYLNDYFDFWFHKGGDPRQYSFALSDSIYAYYLVNGDQPFAVDRLDAMRSVFSAWERERKHPDHFLYWQVPVHDAMEFTISGIDSGDGWKGESYRPSFNSYMYADALAISKVAELAGHEAVASDYREKAAAIKADVQTYLWRPEFDHFIDRYRDSFEFIRGREQVGFIPWMYNLPDDSPKYAKAWSHLMDPDKFNGVYGLRTVEPSYAFYLQQYRENNECQWNGFSWPYATSQTLTAMANLLNNYTQSYVNKADYYALLTKYVKEQYKDGRPYVGEDKHPDEGYWYSDYPDRSEHYLHSTFNDLIINGLVGLRPRADNTIEVNPLVPDAWDWFCLEDIPYHGHSVTILYDRDGSHYKKGRGLSVWVNGRLAASSPVLERVRGVIPSPAIDPVPATRINRAVNPHNEPAAFPVATASYTCAYDQVMDAIDGNVWYYPMPRNRWSAIGSPNSSDWVAVDFGELHEISEVKLYLYGNGTDCQAPREYAVEYWNGSDWQAVNAPVQEPAEPLANTVNSIRFDPIRTSRIRAVFTHKGNGAFSALAELEVYGEGNALVPPAPKRMELTLNGEWTFHKGDAPGAQAAAFDDREWKPVLVPHTWNTFDGQDGGGNYYRGIGWYRRSIFVPESCAGKELYIQFDGVNIEAEVYVNGVSVGNHRGGFARFRFPVTGQIVPGKENRIAVKVSNAYNADIPPLSADFTFFGGIYRDAALLATDPLQIDPLDFAGPGVYVTPSKVSASSADLSVRTKIFNHGSTGKNVTVRTVIVDASGAIVKERSSQKQISGESGADVVQTVTLNDPHLWNGLKDPYLYRVFVEVLDGDTVTDWIEQPLGIRYFSLDPDDGFFLNGNYLDLHGVNKHQDRRNQGWVVSDADIDEDMALIREIGATAIRLAHYQHSQYTYRKTDDMGFVTWAEIPIVNAITESDAFYTNAKQQLTELIRQNYNHPSIVFWSVQNEVTHGSSHNNLTYASRLIEQLAELAKSEDPVRLTTVGSCGHNDHETNWHSDAVAFNKYYGWYGGVMEDFGPWADGIHAAYPSGNIGISEYGVGANTQQHEANPAQPAPGGPWHPEEYQSLWHESHWKQMKERRFLWSKFIWNMFDFAVDHRSEGAQPGLNDKGLVTHDRKIKKDAFFWYKANWSEEPVVYITSRRWTERTQSPVPVKVYANMERVELRVNGVSVGVKAGADHIFRWDAVALNPGANRIEVAGVLNGKSYTDRCIWNYTKPAFMHADGSE